VKPGPLTAERQRTHGEWEATARIAQRLKLIIAEELALKRGPRPSPQQTEALCMILAKIARIVSGDSSHPDHWDDIAGYALLGKGDKGGPP